MLIASSWIVHAPEWFGVVVLAAIAWVVYRGGGGTALEVLRSANGILESRVQELELKEKTQATLIATLQARTDVSIALHPLMAAQEAHETRAQERADAQLAVLEMIAARLGPDHGGV